MRRRDEPDRDGREREQRDRDPRDASRGATDEPPDGRGEPADDREDAIDERRHRSVERDPFVPVRDVGGETELADLGFERDLRLRVAMDEEHAARIASVARALAVGEGAEPVEQLALVGVSRETADRTGLAPDLADLTVELDRRGARLEVRAERAFALVSDEQDRRVRVVDEVAEVADDATAR